MHVSLSTVGEAVLQVLRGIRVGRPEAPAWAGTASSPIFWCARRDSNPHDVTHCHLKAARLPIPPRALGRSARDLRRTRSRPDQRRRCNKSGMEGQGLLAWWFRRTPDQTGLAGARQPRQHLLDFDRDTVAIDHHHAAGDRQVVGEGLDLVGLGGVQLDDGATAQAHYLMDGHGCGPEDHDEIDTDFIEGWHWGPEL